MKSIPDHLIQLAGEVANFEETLQALEVEIHQIGQPAASGLEKRLEALRIKERALNRNLEEALGKVEADSNKMAKAQALFDCIIREETSLKHEADFLKQSNPSSSELVGTAASRVFDLCHQAFKRILGNHRPFGQSVFVNHSEKNLEELYGMARPPADE